MDKILAVIHETLLDGPKTGPELTSEAIRYCYTEQIKFPPSLANFPNYLEILVGSGQLVEIKYIDLNRNETKSLYFHPKAIPDEPRC